MRLDASWKDGRKSGRELSARTHVPRRSLEVTLVPLAQLMHIIQKILAILPSRYLANTLHSSARGLTSTCIRRRPRANSGAKVTTFAPFSVHKPGTKAILV